MSRRHLALAVLSALVVLLPLSPALAVEDVSPARVAGATRIETAAAVARLAFPDGADGAILATSVDFADALSASFLAGVVREPVLLTDQDRLSGEALAALRDLGVGAVTVVGGSLAVSAEVEADLGAAGFDVDRLAGQYRYDTGEQIVRRGVVLGGGYGQLEGQSAVLVASGRSFPDALAGSVLAYDLALPIVLTEADGLPDASAEVLRQLAPDVAYVLGGEGVVSAGVEQALVTAGAGTTRRIAGATRIESARAIADLYAAELDAAPAMALVARGDAYPDALVAGPLGGERAAPLLLTPSPTQLGGAAADYLAKACASIEVLQAIGGQAALTEDVLATGERAAETCEPAAGGPPAAGSQRYAVEPLEPRVGVPGERERFTLTRRDGEPAGETVDLALFPLAGADVLGEGADTFPDADGNGYADGLGTSDTGVAAFDTLNDVDIGDQPVLYDAVLNEGTVTWELNAATADEVIAVAWTDDGDGQLDVDANGTPTEPYGLGVARWAASGALPATRLYDISPSVAQAAPGGEIEAVVGPREDGEPLPDELALALFPAGTTDIAGDDGDVFADTDGDGQADNLGRSDTEYATIAALYDTKYEARGTIVYGVQPRDGAIRITLRADVPDATVLVGFQDTDGDEQLDVDAAGHPLEPYTTGTFGWG